MTLKTSRKRASARKSLKKVFVDFPQEGEHVRPGNYSIRVGAVANGGAEVTVNGKTWNKCRPSVGYYWFDWRAEKPGPVKIVALI